MSLGSRAAAKIAFSVFFNDFGGLSQFRNPAAWPVWLFTRDKRGMRYYVDVACVE